MLLMVLNWFWEIELNRAGPDYLFLATFKPSEGLQLAEEVRQQPLPGFKHYTATNSPCWLHNHNASYDLYMDEYHYEQLVANIEGKNAANIWIYNIITVCGCDLKIERGYGGSLGGEVETDLILKLSHSPNLTIVKWAVVCGGNGYNYTDMATGTSTAELLDYLLGITR
ncbi:hypothetical protein ACE1CD_15905 [Aerosakkonema sp. BLCC-F183]